jgi:hypothetical protein
MSCVCVLLNCAPTFLSLSLLDAILPLVIRFLDQFPHALDVIVSCARKTEVALWDHLFSSVGKPEDLFEVRSSCRPVKSLTHFWFASYAWLMEGYAPPPRT